MSNDIKLEQGYARFGSNPIKHPINRITVGKRSGDGNNSERAIIRLEGSDRAITRIKSEYGGIRLLEEMLFEFNLNLLRNEEVFNVRDYISRGRAKGCSIDPGYDLPSMPATFRTVIDYSNGTAITQLKVTGEFPGALTTEAEAVLEDLIKRKLNIDRFGPRKESYCLY